MEKDTIFLTTAEAMAAICFDFRQYGSQMLLFCEIIRLISGGHVFVKRDIQKNGLWIGEFGRRNMRWMDETDLAEYVCQSLADVELNPQVLAMIATRVFQARAFPESDPETGRCGIRIETGMENFECRQCGQCCLSLDYHDALTAEDVACWQDLGRTDILEWVGVFSREGREPAYRMWMIPGTKTEADKCPFLQQDPASHRWRCRIHDVKPTICRQYPVSRKHAIMTGCPGFNHPKTGDGAG